MQLSIDVVPGTNPPVFKWTQTIDTINGRQVVEHDGTLPPTVEVAVKQLLDLCKKLNAENVEIRKHRDVLGGTINMVVDRLGGTVEGKPTHNGNLLQRVDELVAIEAKQAAPQVFVKKSKG